MGDSAGAGKGEVWEPLMPRVEAWLHTWDTLFDLSKLGFFVCKVAMLIPTPTL